MKNRTKFLAALGLISGLAVTGYALNADAGGSHGRDGGHHKGKRMMHMMERYDVNGDSALTQDEVLGERAKQFKTFDKNTDGVLDLAEYKALWAEAMNERMVRGFQRYDRDGDGRVSEQDYSKKIARMIAWMDKNGDAKVDRDDFHRPHKAD
ncbi:MAG: hypothetical protein WD075_09385 [Rhodospirillales bacterium]